LCSTVQKVQSITNTQLGKTYTPPGIKNKINDVSPFYISFAFEKCFICRELIFFSVSLKTIEGKKSGILAIYFSFFKKKIEQDGIDDVSAWLRT
jgi:hypothetical protein